MGYGTGCVARTLGSVGIPCQGQRRILFSDGGRRSNIHVVTANSLQKSSCGGIHQSHGAGGYYRLEHLSSSYAFGSNEIWLGISKTCKLSPRCRGWSVFAQAKGPSEKSPEPQYSSQAKIRSEVISPFRTVRMFFSLAFIASGSLGFLLTLPRLIGALGHAANASPVEGVLKDLAIDLAAVAAFGLLYRSDTRARNVQLAKLSREETLGALRVELANKKVVTLEQLRGLCRIVIVSGPTSYVQEALDKGEQLREELLERGVLVVPYPTDGPRLSSQPTSSSVQQNSGSTAAIQEQTVVTPTSRWLANPIYTAEWTRWLKEQKKLANLAEDKSVYISLRLDGRVRGSGVSLPPWKAFVAQLPPMKGIWKGPLDGMDGRI
ncbi:hypothetical protein R1sor_021770 [Riccia sorocarpa]|uniref:Uncharacterized protein n=1 Tax=Riccia sorocarpa TaxID=122646 RepID=A0ABD3GNR8_9MARC